MNSLIKIVHLLKKNGIVQTFKILHLHVLFKAKIVFINFITGNKLKDYIVIESHNDFDTNGGALYRFLIKNHINDKYRIIWLLNNKATQALPQNVSFVYKKSASWKKAYYFCKARFFFLDSCIVSKANKEQTIVYMTHGSTSLKNTRGLENASGADFVLAPSHNFTPYIREVLSLTPQNKLLYLGYPEFDDLFQNTDSQINKITKQQYSKRILWAPTFRKLIDSERNDSSHQDKFGIPLIESLEQLHEFNEYLKRNGVLLVIKIHPKQDLSAIQNIRNESNILVLTINDVKQYSINNMALFKDFDALIGDYSSMTYQFLLLDRPIAYEFSDLKEYKLGLIIQESDYDTFLVGPICNSLEDIYDYIDSVCKGEDRYREKREKLAKWMYENCDGHSCERLLKYFNII